MRFKVRVEETEIYYVTLEADNSDEVYEMAVEMVAESPGKYHHDSDGNVEIVEEG